jgi:hypothetical protein
MSHFCSTKMKLLRTDWFPAATDAKIRALRHYGGNLQAINAHINTFFDAHVINPVNRVCVTLNCQNPWPAVLVPLWDASGNDEGEAALFLGGLYCRVAIARPEAWTSVPYPIFHNRADPNKWAPRRYVLGQDMVEPRSVRRS